MPDVTELIARARDACAAMRGFGPGPHQLMAELADALEALAAPAPADGWIRTSERTPKDAGLADDDVVIVCDEGRDDRGVGISLASYVTEDFWQKVPPVPPLPAPAAPKVERPMDAKVYDPPLDPGIAKQVEALQAAGVETFESCEGGDGHAYPEPTVRFHGQRAEGFRALAVAMESGLRVAGLRRVWPINEEEPTGPFWELVFV